MDAAITPLVLKSRLAAFPPPTLVDVRRQPAFDAGSRGHSRRDSPPSRRGRCLGSRPRALASRRRLLRARPRSEPERRDGVACARLRRALPRRRSRALARRGPRDAAVCGADTWVTRARPKIDRIACPWLIRRFIDASAEFLYVPECRGARVRRRERRHCLRHPGRRLLARRTRMQLRRVHPQAQARAPRARRSWREIVRAADTSTLERSPQAPGLLAASLGLSAMFADDHAMLKWGMLVYDSLYAWCRDAQTETHGWYPEKLRDQATA